MLSIQQEPDASSWKLRREQVEFVSHVKEVCDKGVTVLLVLLLVSLLLKPIVKDINDVLEAVVKWADWAIACLVIFYGLLRFFYLRPASKPNPTKEDCEVLRRWLLGGEEPKTEYQCVCRFASEADTRKMTDLDSEGFGASDFAVEPEKLLERNTNWIKRNSNIFMFIFNPMTKSEYAIGYSCLVPLNEDGAKLYWNGKLKDEDIPPALIASPQEIPSAVLICGVMLKKEFSYTRGRAAREFTLYFMDCIRYHLKNLYPQLYKNKLYPDLYAQTEQPSIYRRLKRMGFAETHQVSAEGYKLLWLKEPFRPRKKED